MKPATRLNVHAVKVATQSMQASIAQVRISYC